MLMLTHALVKCFFPWRMISCCAFCSFVAMVVVVQKKASTLIWWKVDLMTIKIKDRSWKEKAMLSRLHSSFFLSVHIIVKTKAIATYDFLSFMCTFSIIAIIIIILIFSYLFCEFCIHLLMRPTTPFNLVDTIISFQTLDHSIEWLEMVPLLLHFFSFFWWGQEKLSLFNFNY